MTENVIQVLLLEEDAQHARLVKTILESDRHSHFAVTHLIRLADGLQKIKETSFHVVLSDLLLPDVQGIEICKALHAAAPNVPVVVLTSLDNEQYALTAVHHGAQDFLMMSPDGDTLPGLARALRYAIERNRLTMELEAMGVELKRSRDLAMESARAKADFLATMSHEIRTPMNAIIGMNNLLLDTTLNDQQREFAQIAREAGENLLQIINDILDFSKIEAGKFQIDSTHFNPRSVVEGTVRMMADAAKRKGIDLTVSIDDRLPEGLQGDPVRLRQILTNLVGNAVKFTERGKVEVRAIVKAETSALVTALFSVQDTGIGLSPQARQKLFQPFSQADSSTTRKYGGTGLGLSISKRLVELMGGALGADGRPEGGTDFWFQLVLPKSKEASCTAGSDPARKEQSSSPSAKSCRILVAEDNPLNQRFISHLLMKLGYAQVDFAASGKEVLSRLEQNTYDLVLMDCMMPDMDGYQTAMEIRKRENKTKRVPIIAVSANVLPGDREKGLAAEMDDYIAKPFGPDELRRVLNLWIKADQ